MFFLNNYESLANTYTIPNGLLKYEGIVYPSAEHLYQALKTDSIFKREMIASIPTPIEAMRFWKDRSHQQIDRIETMRIVVNAKFNIPMFSAMLLSIPDEEIVEENMNHELFFGTSGGEGRNHLGKLLMEKRESLRASREFIRNGVIKGNLYDNVDKYDYIVFTSNSVITKDKRLMMDTGTAKIVKDIYPDVDKQLAKNIRGRDIYNLEMSKKHKVIALQTKVDWNDSSSIELVEESIDKLCEFAKKHPRTKIGMPILGMSTEGFSINDVIPMLQKLPRNVSVWMLPTFRIATIGSRVLPDDIKDKMVSLVGSIRPDVLEKLTALHGGAKGADSIWGSLFKNEMIFLPTDIRVLGREATNIATFHHPFFSRLKDFTKKLMSRNAYQVLSDDLNTPVDCVLCYTPDGVERRDDIVIGTTGGTGLAISIADTYGIPVFNIKNESSYEDAILYINSLVQEA